MVQMQEVTKLVREARGGSRVAENAHALGLDGLPAEVGTAKAIDEEQAHSIASRKLACQEKERVRIYNVSVARRPNAFDLRRAQPKVDLCRTPDLIHAREVDR